MGIDQTVELQRTITALAARMATLEQRIEAQAAEIDRLRGHVAPPAGPSQAPRPILSRRQLLQRMGGVIAATVAAGALALPQAALAAKEGNPQSTTGGPLLIGQSNAPTAPADSTTLYNPSSDTLAGRMCRVANYTNSDAAQEYGTGYRIGLVASVSGTDTGTLPRIAIIGVTDGGVGVLGRSLSPAGSAIGVRGETIDGTGVRGSASGGLGWGVYGSGGEYGGIFQGSKAPLRILEAGFAGAPSSGTHSRGEFIVDNQGVLYFCTKTGTPGTWARLTPATTALPLITK